MGSNAAIKGIEGWIGSSFVLQQCGWNVHSTLYLNVADLTTVVLPKPSAMWLCWASRMGL